MQLALFANKFNSSKATAKAGYVTKEMTFKLTFKFFNW